MAVYLTRAVKDVLKRIPLLYSVVGLLRYLQHKRLLSAAERRHQMAGDQNIPPPRLRYRVHGSLDPITYTTVADTVATAIQKAVTSNDLASFDNLTVLDFACGPGRIAAEFKKRNPSSHLHGTDIDAEAVEWAQNNLGAVGQFAVNGILPPTRYGNGQFGLLYTVSLFTHLDENLQFAWLEEFARIVRPGGFVIATVHGRLAQKGCSLREQQDLAATGFSFRVDRIGSLKLDGLPDFYQTTFHTQAYVRRVWGKWFEIADYIEGGLHDHQDIIVLRSRDESNAV